MKYQYFIACRWRDKDAVMDLAGKSAHIEAGAAFGMGKKCILIGEQKEAESNYLIFDESYSIADEFINNIR